MPACRGGQGQSCSSAPCWWLGGSGWVVHECSQPFAAVPQISVPGSRLQSLVSVTSPVTKLLPQHLGMSPYCHRLSPRWPYMGRRCGACNVFPSTSTAAGGATPQPTAMTDLSGSSAGHETHGGVTLFCRASQKCFQVLALLGVTIIISHGQWHGAGDKVGMMLHQAEKTDPEENIRKITLKLWLIKGKHAEMFLCSCYL